MNLEREDDDGWFIFNDDELKDFDTVNTALERYSDIPQEKIKNEVEDYPKTVDLNQSISTACGTECFYANAKIDAPNLTPKNEQSDKITVEEECSTDIIHHNYDIKIEEGCDCVTERGFMLDYVNQLKNIPQTQIKSEDKYETKAVDFRKECFLPTANNDDLNLTPTIEPSGVESCYLSNDQVTVKDGCFADDIHHNYDIKNEEEYICQENNRVFVSDSNNQLIEDNKFNFQKSNNTFEDSLRKHFISFGCNICDQIFEKKIELDQHVCSFNNNLNQEYICCIFNMDEDKCKFICEKCKQDDRYQTSTFVKFKKHVILQHDDLKILYLCAQCVEENVVKKFRNELSHLKSHIRSVHMEKKFKCDSCDYKTDTKSSLRRHFISIHMKEKAFKCTHCSYKTTQKIHLQSHVAAVHLKEKNFECNLCSYKSAIKDALRNHIEKVHLKERRFNCTLCSFKSGDKANLKRHIQTIHMMKKDYKCTMCNYSAAQKGNIESHIKAVHEKKKNYECKFCSYKAGKSDHIQNHIRTVHDKEKNFKCTFCSYQSGYNSAIKYHIKTVHKNEKNFKCNICDYKTASKSRLDLHVKTVHLKEKDFECNLCTYKTGNNKSLKVHIKTVHMKQKDFECSFCPFKSGQSSNLKTHIKVVHMNEKNHKCTQCDYKTGTNTNLKRHIKLIHGIEENKKPSVTIKKAKTKKKR